MANWRLADPCPYFPNRCPLHYLDLCYRQRSYCRQAPEWLDPSLARAFNRERDPLRTEDEETASNESSTKQLEKEKGDNCDS